jgi:hypothetical protein
VATLWVTNVAETTHLTKELRHWTILLDLLGERPLGAKRFVRSHSEKADQTAGFLRANFFRKGRSLPLIEGSADETLIQGQSK